jgi:flagellar motor switch protein FliM
MNKLSVHYYYSSSNQKVSPDNIKAIKAKLQDSQIPLKVILGQTQITVKDLLELSVGDVVPLERNYRDELEIRIGQRTKFLGKPGVHGNKMAVQVTQVIEEDNTNE